MKKYTALDPAQGAAIRKLSSFFDPTQNKEDNPAVLDTKYIKVAEVLTPEQKKILEQHEEEIQRGFDKYSAY
jgi:Spy/CpxP family protein refolding chaperone